MKRIQQISLLLFAIGCLYAAYSRYFVYSYGWRSPAILIAISAVLFFQVWELERPEKELTMNELMEEMQANKTENIKWYQKPMMGLAGRALALIFCIWLQNGLLIVASVIAIFFFLVQIALEQHEESKKQAEAEELMKKIDELKGEKEEA